jgi:hypothetical protein
VADGGHAAGEKAGKQKAERAHPSECRSPVVAAF